MTTNQDRVLYLLQQYQSRQIGWEEMQELFACINSGDHDLVLQRYLAEKLETTSLNNKPEQVDWDFMFQQVTQHQAAVKTATRIRYMQRSWWAAAIIFMLVGLTTFWLLINRQSTSEKTAPAVIAQTIIQPGRDGAILTLADGTQVSLDSIKNSNIGLQGGAAAKLVNGVLVYEKRGDEIVYNTMSTPKGRQFQISLPDGTQVWLNAGSSIRYPTVFAGSERRVAVTGEAYFEVSRNTKMPFMVNINNKATVEVLGTSFNILAYENETLIKTTLLEGAVLVNTGKQQQKLKPGQQAQIGADKLMNISDNVDTDKVLAWKNGLFNFEGASLGEIMRQLERWYDIEVKYEKGIPHKLFEGEMTRGVTLNQFLATIKEFGIRYRLDGRTLTILP